MVTSPYRRVLLKLSGEALASPNPSESAAQGLSQEMLIRLAKDIQTVHQLGIEICLVIGGGNIYRGAQGNLDYGIDRATSDYMGMLATIINGLALQNAIEHTGTPCQLVTSIPMEMIGEPYIRKRCLRHLEKKRVLLFAGGTGNPFFTTDTAAALRASEMDCDLMLKATKVNGIYCSDPKTNQNARLYDRLSYQDVLIKDLQAMDATAIALARENKMPIAVFSIYEPDGFRRVLMGETDFTLIQPETIKE